MITIFTVFTSKSAIRGLLLSYLFLSMGMMAQAQDQQVTVPVGSPSAMKSLDSTILPEPPSKFGEEINLNAYQSKPWWPPQITPPQGAPNILLIMTDDVGFGAPSRPSNPKPSKFPIDGKLISYMNRLVALTPNPRNFRSL